jgi:glycosyltransferase involved in cell wall biosynthesis
LSPKLSVLLPTRNGGRLLDGCVRSVLEQECDDFEPVVSDNASDQESRDVRARFANDPRLKLTRRELALEVLRFTYGDFVSAIRRRHAARTGATRPLS